MIKPLVLRTYEALLYIKRDLVCHFIYLPKGNIWPNTLNHKFRQCVHISLDVLKTSKGWNVSSYMNLTILIAMILQKLSCCYYITGLTLTLLDSFWNYTPHQFPIYSQDSRYKLKQSGKQFGSWSAGFWEASWSGSTLFSKQDIPMFSMLKG